MEQPKRHTPFRWLLGCFFLLCVLAASAATEPRSNRVKPQPRAQPASLIRSIAEACPRRYVSRDPSALACPNTTGLTILPAHYPPRTLFVGYDPEPRYLKLLNNLIVWNTKRQDPLQIVMLIPRLDVEQAYEDLTPWMRRPESPHLTFFIAPADETIWPQDYLEIGLSIDDGEAKIIDLPYTAREGESIPAALALSCQLELIPQAKDEDQGALPQSGDYGGNIEALPGNILLIGNTMTQGTRSRLQDVLSGMSILDMNVQWLDTGHVDEVFAVLPNLSPKASCPFAMIYTSPKLALHIIRQKGLKASQDRIVPRVVSLEDVSVELKDWTFFSDCLEVYAKHKILSKRCNRLIKANMLYDQLIEKDRERIHQALVKHHACESITWIALPQLFVPSFAAWLQSSTWGTEDDHAQAINPNVVNVIALGKELIVPQQPYLPFEHEVERRLKPLGLLLRRADSAFSHFLNGGLHCNTAVARMCRPRESKSVDGITTGFR